MHKLTGAAALIFLAVVTACGGSPAQPTSPASPPATGSTDGPALKLDIKADEAGSRDAVAFVSEVIADASRSTGTGALTFSIDFGDGFVSTAPLARHVYRSQGAFTITATVTDAQGRKASDSRAMAVRTLTGRWFQAEYVRKSARVEIRRLTVTGQDGLTIHGSYRVTGDADKSFSGTLSSPRNVSIAIDGGASLEGVIPGRLDDASDHWSLLAHGDTVDGERLEFRAIVGDASAPPPDAVMKLSFDTDDPGAWGPWASLNPVRVDGASSRGTDLMYFIEFGDGFVATTAQAAHIVDVTRVSVDTRQLTARLTVVDPFGQSDVESEHYYTVVLGAEYRNLSEENYWISTTPWGGLKFRFHERTGVNYVGVAYLQPGWEFGKTALATLSGAHDVRITVPESGLEYRGTIKMSPGNGALMTVVQSGGADNGRTWTLYLNSVY